MANVARTQYLSYNLLAKAYFSPNERALLQIISIRPQYCLENLNQLGIELGRSARTVQRVIERLIQKGVIQKRYTVFKRMVLTIVPMDVQDKIAKTGIVSQVLKFCKFAKYKKKRHDTTSVSGIDTTSLSGSIKSSNKENSILIASLKKFDFRPKDLEAEKKRQLKAYYEMINAK